MKPRPSTSADVAFRAGVSRATVSYVLNATPNQSIPEATRLRVLEAAADLDYIPHAAARALRAGESRLVLLVNTGVPYGTNLSTMIDALDTEVAAGGRALVVWQQRYPADLGATVANLQPVATLALGRLTEDQRDLLDRRGVPYVEAGADLADPIDHGTVMQVDHLIERGHRRLGFLTTADPALAMFAEPRLATVQATCAARGLPPADVHALPAAGSVTDLGQVLTAWATEGRITAVACYNDVCAAAALAAADDARIEVPAQLAVVGMDDEPMSRYTRPALSTVALQMTDYARTLWAHTAAALAGQPQPPTGGAVPARLIPRNST